VPVQFLYIIYATNYSINHIEWLSLAPKNDVIIWNFSDVIILYNFKMHIMSKIKKKLSKEELKEKKQKKVLQKLEEKKMKKRKSKR